MLFQVTMGESTSLCLLTSCEMSGEDESLGPGRTSLVMKVPASEGVIKSSFTAGRLRVQGGTQGQGIVGKFCVWLILSIFHVTGKLFSSSRGA